MINRRRFMCFIGVFFGTSLSLPLRLVKGKSLAIPIEKVKPLQEVGGSVMITVKGREILFVRDTEETIRALDPKCTHRGCTVAYNKNTKRIECPCHQSVFNLEGVAERGPASKPLKAYEAKLEGDRMIVSLD